MVTATQLSSMLRDARRRTHDLITDLEDEQLLGPRLEIVNPMLWEIGHVTWFQERWALRHLRGERPFLDRGDALYNSATVAHDTRWDIPLLSRGEALAYMDRVLNRVLERLEDSGPGPLPNRVLYFHLLPLFHEDMHGEAFAYTRQTLAYSSPRFSVDGSPPEEPATGGIPVDDSEPEGGPLPGDVALPGGEFVLGASIHLTFVFDNEKWAHPVHVAPFCMARAATTQGEFRAFVEDEGYTRRDLWTDAGWAWRQREVARCPVYWRKEAEGSWLRRVFDRWVPLEEHRPVLHVNWFEADAYCRWAGRRLPTEVEWEYAAASGRTNAGSDRLATKPVYPWGDDSPGPTRANLDGIRDGTCDVGVLRGGDTPSGLRQLIGNTWEWTASDFLPYPGFSEDPYREYSRPFFGTQKVLRGGCWVTRSRLIRNIYRNYYTPDRRDVWVGFRTCAVDPDGRKA